MVAAPRSDQPANLKPLTLARSPDWKLLDWSLKPLPEKPGVQLRASSYLATGKYPFVRIEQEIEILPSGQAKVLKTVEMVGDQIIVKLPEGSSAEEIQSLAAKLGGQAAAKPFAPNTWLVALPRRLEAVPEALAGTTNSGVSINYAEPNHLVRPMRSPNDPRFTNFNQWHLYNNSQLGVDIKAAKAWDRRTSASSGTTNKVIVAVIDSGVRYTHEDLLPNMWTNPGEILGDGWDNDGNGLVDDIYGADYLGNDGDPITTDSHGTHCAGLIAGVGNNGLGITGVAWSGVQIMALRFIDVTGSTDDNVQCIDYAISKGAKIINASYGAVYNPNRTEIEAIKRAENSGIIMVAAAGNGTDEPYTDQNANQRYDSGEPFTDWNSSGTWDKWHNNDTKPFYPASYSTHTFPRSFFTPATTITLNNIISVGATDRNDNKPSFSNFGADSVDLMAPGVEMWSTSISGTSNSYYASSQGTSFAAPVVAGALALLIAEYPNDTVSQRVARVVNTNAVDVVPALSGLCKTGGRLNLAKLLPTADVSTLPQALAWHRPSHSEPLINSPMRTPSPILLSNDVTIFSGLKKFNNTNGINTNGLANQTGGWLFYRTSGTNAWSSNALAFHTNSGDYQFWKATLPSVSARTYEYYLQLDFDSGARTTFLHYSNSADEFATTTTQTTAQASPYSFTVPKTAASITLAGLNQTYNGSAQSVSITTSPPGLSYTVTYDGTSSAPTNAGTYNVVATITDPNYEGSSTSTLTIAKATATISLGELNQTYDGTARMVTHATTPSGLATSLTYNGNPSAPINAGSFSVVATIIDSNYQGSVTETLTVAKASAMVTLGNTSQIYDGSIRSVSTTTTPLGLSTSTTYGGSSTAPVNAGTYTVVATVTDPNHEGSSTSTLTVAKAPTSVSIAPTASSIRLGQTLADSSLNGGVASVQGSFSFTQPTLVPALGTSSYPVKFTPDVSSNYLDALTNTSVTVGGILDPSQDSDGDGISNLLEHALAGFSTPPSTSSPLGLITTQSL
ncbi:MAG: MBG domain-containing protein, partial [Verrucomicrobia bacterium]|nr:MBG domain-containing protein [Verrucomicrobiota bacterium]